MRDLVLERENPLTASPSKSEPALTETQRILLLAAADIEAARPSFPGFDLAVYGRPATDHPCGTQACIAGYITFRHNRPLYDRSVECWRRGWPTDGIGIYAAELLELDDQQARALFVPWDVMSFPAAGRSPAVAVAVLRDLARHPEVPCWLCIRAAWREALAGKPAMD